MEIAAENRNSRSFFIQLGNGMTQTALTFPFDLGLVRWDVQVQLALVCRCFLVGSLDFGLADDADLPSKVIAHFITKQNCQDNEKHPTIKNC
jgi:hypothetical protein